MADTELHYLELLDVSRLIQSRQLSSVEATQALLDRIDALDGRLGSYARVMREQALADARRADAELASGVPRGPLHGVPIAVKDLCWTAGVVSAAGMTIHGDFVPTEDATVVGRQRVARPGLLGQLQMDEGGDADHPPANAGGGGRTGGTRWGW